MSKVTAERLREVLSYDPETGAFTWRVATSYRVRAGSVAGCVDKYGYVVIRVDGKLCLGHRLAWLYVNGEWPSKHLDHINRNKSDNRVCNLRLCNDLENGQNTNLSKANTSGVKGVIRHRDGRWIAQIFVDRKNVYLGIYDTIEEAAAARKAAEKEYHPFNSEAA